MEIDGICGLLEGGVGALLEISRVFVRVCPIVGSGGYAGRVVCVSEVSREDEGADGPG